MYLVKLCVQPNKIILYQSRVNSYYCSAKRIVDLFQDIPAGSVPYNSVAGQVCFYKDKLSEMTSPNGVPEQILNFCAHQLASLSISSFPIYFTETSIIPIAKKNKTICLNYHHPVALTSIAMKCFQRKVMAHICGVSFWQQDWSNRKQNRLRLLTLDICFYLME